MLLAKLWKEAASFFMSVRPSVRPSARKSSVPTGRIFMKFNIRGFFENLSSGSRVVSRGRKDGRTDRHDEANSRFSQFFEHT